MNKKNHSNHFLIMALVASIIIVYFIARPFLGPLILAAVFAFLFQPIYQRFLVVFKTRESLSALCTTLIAIILILLPITFIGTQIFKESSQMYQSLVHGGSDNFVGSIENVLNQARKILPIPADFKIDFGQYARQGLEILIENLGAIFSSFAKILINSIMFLFAFYFFLRDGRKLKNYFVALSPLEDNDDEFIVSRLKSAVSAVVKGNLAIGIIQGILTGIGFAIFGVPNPVLWGGVATISAFLPGIGTALVITPAIIFLFVTGNSFGGIGLLIWGVVAVGLVDNFLGPRLIGRGMQLHPLAVFVSVLGGIAFFGPLGFILGPLAVGVCMALIDIYASLRVREKDIA
jgi:predicted PurR-regulated permease PerM